VDVVLGALEAVPDPAMDVAVAHALVRLVEERGEGAVLRLYRPAGRVVAFGQLDARRPGFPAAAEAVRRGGFAPVVRAPGGRAVAYTEQALVVDHVCASAGSPSGIDDRFREFGELWTGVLRDLGVDARVGAVPGEYCPGAYSVNARGVVKLVGTAQRVVRGAWLFSAVAIVGDDAALRPVLAEVYRCLGLPFAAASVGSVSGEVPGVSPEIVECALLDAYRSRAAMVPSTLRAEVLSRAAHLIDRHRVPEVGPEGDTSG
jgi:octanoyl-[GcvH]:protein N-octanoyltransferase